jgi:replicative DNA helicase
MIDIPSLSCLEAEEYILGACLVRPQVFEAVWTAVPCGGCFFLRDHQIIFEAMIQLAGAGQTIGRNTVAQALKQDKVWAAIGGENKLVQLSIQGSDSHGFTVESACVEIVGYYKRREAVSAASVITDTAYDLSMDHSEVSSRAQEAVGSLEVSSTGGPVSIADCSAAIYQQMVTETEPGVLTGLHDFDAMLYGAEEGNLIIVGARPAMGKTILGLSWAGFGASICNKQVLYFSLEMSR